MLKNILDYEFTINGQAIDRSGQNNHGLNTSTVASIGPGTSKGVGFLSRNSRITVPHRPCWNEITAARIDIRFALDHLETRANLLEIERSLALFVRADGVVTFTFYAPADQGQEPGPGGAALPDSIAALPPPTGSTDPFDTIIIEPPPDLPDFGWHGVNTDAPFAPDGQRRTVPLQQYVTVSAVHDGLATMRLFLDGVLAGVRSDIRYPVLPLAAPRAVSIGAWPHDSRYTLRGRIDFVRFWRHDPQYVYRQFFCRPMSRTTQRCWHDLFRAIMENFDDSDRQAAIAELFTCLNRIEVARYRAIARNGEASLQRLQAFTDEYARIWCAGDIDRQVMGDYMTRFLAWLRSESDEVFVSSVQDVLACFIKSRDLRLLELGADLGKCDPAWPRFISEVGRAMPNPLAPPELPRATDDTCDADGQGTGHGHVYRSRS
jgi:hypothetical protein